MKRVALGPEALAYVADRLNWGLTLGELIAARGWVGAEPYTWLPGNHDPAHLHDFERGGMLPIPDGKRPGQTHRIPDTNEELAEHIASYLDGGATRICVFENALACRDDPHTTSEPNVVTFDREVYHVLRGPSIPRDHVCDVIRAARTVLSSITVLSSVRHDWVLSETFSQQELEEIADRAVEVIAGAYDGESYVVAKRRASEPEVPAGS